MTFFNLQAGTRENLYGLRGSAGIYHLAGLGRRAVLIVDDIKKASEAAEAYRAYRPGARVHIMPPLEGSPFSFAPLHPATRRARLRCLDAVLRDTWDLIVTVPHVMLEVLPSQAALLHPRLRLETAKSYDLNALTLRLVEMGYLSVDMVAQPGDFSKRGGILDIYGFADEIAYRLDFFDDELEEIRTFDVTTQRATGHTDAFDVLPVFEWIIDEEASNRFNRKAGMLWNQSGSREAFLELVAGIRDRGRFSGYLHWTALFTDKPRHLWDLLPQDTLYFGDDWEAIEASQETFLTNFMLQIEASSGGKRLSATPHTLFNLNDPKIIPLSKEATVLRRHQLHLDDDGSSFITQSVPHYNNDVARFLSHWRPQAKRMAVVVVTATEGMKSRLEDLFEDEEVNDITFPLDNPAPGFYLALGALHTGFTDPDKALVVISERDIWSKTTSRKRGKVGKKIFHSEFRDLKTGDLVVHLDHGIGRFLGLVEMEAGGGNHEMMAVEFRGGEKLYINLQQLDLVQRYGSDNSHVQLDKLGGVSWSKAKARVKKAVRQLAGELLKLYAARDVVKGHQFGPDTEWQAEFEEAFEHEPTEGQLGAVAEIKADLESPKPMDRLLVGDVGFGKTEVAMRMAFKCVMEGFQVAVLCPTTVLAFQHYRSFRDRFSGFPVKIHWISRFTSPAQTKKTLAETAQGTVDILIGTHRILSKDVTFHKLGGLIIDEEQRFGVAHKERLKQIRKQVEVLSMSATPIPRTLYMSMSGIRDISVIETPPRNRLAISTTVAEAREHLIKNAIDFELQRGGQVFFIHNRVETMDQIAAGLRALAPNAEIAAAHGQMDAKRIESVMVAFMERKVDILVASTIIENGVDIPNANTMLVNRADMFGISQLYQLRGRIGRSDRPAFAYLLVPPRARMSSEARTRLATLEEFSDLGSGFRVAAMDMELRGAGNVLGGEQAGHINTIGFEMYRKLLAEAVAELKGEPIEDDFVTTLNLKLGSAIPRSYMEETNQRLHHYKKLAGARTPEEIQAERETMTDCFGRIPPETEMLCLENELRIFLSARKVQTVEREKHRIKLRFHSEAEVNGGLVLSWIQAGRDVFATPEGAVSFRQESEEPHRILQFIREKVTELTPEPKPKKREREG